MPKKIQNCDVTTLIGVPLPNHAATYTVISHQFVIDYTKQALATAGFVISSEEYRSTADGQIAQGIYRLSYNQDPELSMMFAWTNSYNKQVKFKCVVGAYINNTESVMISGEIGNWVRKHTGTADTETKATIDSYVTNAHMYYTQLVSDKSKMEAVTLNKRRQAQLLGVLFAEYEILTTEQASAIRDLMKRPPYMFSSSDSLWAFYNYVTIALQSSHPRTWMEDQRILHYFIGTICDFSAPVQPVSEPVQELSEPVENLSEPVDPLTTNYGQPKNQTNILVQIAEITGDTSVLEPQVFNTNTLNQIADLEADQIDENVKYTAAEETVLTEDELAHELYGVDNDIEVSISPEVSEIDLDAEEDDDWNKLESAGIITPCVAHDAETVKNEIISLEPTPENYKELELEESVQEEQADLTNFADTIDFDLDSVEETREKEDDDIPDFF